jgi:hypothetical protein
MVEWFVRVIILAKRVKPICIHAVHEKRRYVQVCIYGFWSNNNIRNTCVYQRMYEYVYRPPGLPACTPRSFFLVFLSCIMYCIVPAGPLSHHYEAKHNNRFNVALHTMNRVRPSLILSYILSCYKYWVPMAPSFSTQSASIGSIAASWSNFYFQAIWADTSKAARVADCCRGGLMRDTTRFRRWFEPKWHPSSGAIDNM